jgi:predicted DNA-binding transcriptional regulator AlpA
MESSKDELLKELNKIELLVRQNPCRMKEVTFKALAAGLRALVSKDFHTDMSLEQVALYFGVTTRTINTWQHKYGFPKGKQVGHHELSFSAEDILQWREQHKDIVS